MFPPNVDGGILALRDTAEHKQALAEPGIEPIELVVVTLYPFRVTLAKTPIYECSA